MKINDLELVKTKENGLIKGHVIELRKLYARAYEPWSEYEYSLLSIALHITNDISLIAKAFKRSSSSIEKAITEL